MKIKKFLSVFLIFSQIALGESYPLLNAQSPITYDQGTGTVGILTSNGTQAGALSAANWTAFNNKQAALTFGNLLSGTTGVTIGTGTARLVGGDATVSIQTASNSQPGLLSAADWVTFNAKSPAITKGNLTTTTVGVTVGSGTQAVIGAGTTVDIATASGSQPGLLSSANWTTFNGKQNALSFGALSSSTGALTVTGGSGAVVGSGTSLSIATADSSHTGLISSTDWTTFNNKQSTITSGNLSSPAPAITITGGTGSVLGSGTTINIANATASMTGLLSFLDWQAFNAKQAALTLGNLTTSTGSITITGGTGAVVGSGATINIPTANGAQSGILSAANWTTFSNKAPLNSPPFTGTPTAPAFALNGSTSGTLTLTVPAVVTDYTIKFPASQGIANTTLVNDGSGNLAWQVGVSGGAIWGDITGTLSAQTDLQAALNLKAPLASPAFTGTPHSQVYALAGSTSGFLTQSVPATVTDYTVKWPAAQGAATSVLTNDGSGNLSWGGGAVWGSITGTLSAQTDLQNALNLKANLASPTFTGTITGPNYRLSGSSSGFLTETVPATVTSYSVIWPSAQGGANTFLKNDGSGNLSWGSSGSSPATPVWTKYTYNASDFSAASTSHTITITAGSKTVVNGVVVGVVTPFSGGSATNVYVTLGTDTTSPSEITSGFDLIAASTGDTQSTATLQEVATYAAESITITAESVGANLNTLSAGQIEVWIQTATLP